MLNYIIFVNNRKDLIVLDSETSNKKCKPELGYITECDDWRTDKEEYMEDEDIWFDKDKAFQEVGIYKVEGYNSNTQTPDGDYYDYYVTKITKILNFKY